MARYDKYDPVSGGFRAPLAAAIAVEQVGVPLGVGLDANGRVDITAPASGVLAVLVVDSPKAAGDIVDCMTDGEIVGVTVLPSPTASTAGTVYYADASDGDITSVAPAAGVAGVRVGHTVEASRLVVRVAPVSTPV